LAISDFPITVRINENTSKKLLNKIARVMRHGGGIVAVYNEPLILKALTDYGYPLTEARGFANDGCWEVQIPGKTNFMYIPFDSLAVLQKITLNGYEKTDFSTFDELYTAFTVDLQKQVEEIYQYCLNNFAPDTDGEDSWEWNKATPSSVVSLFTNGCIENARSYHNNGPVYNVLSPHIGGIADTVNSLYAIKKLVFDDKKTTLQKLFNALKANWQGYELLRAQAAALPYYGTDDNNVDELYRRVSNDFTTICARFDKKSPFFFPAGASTFGREIDWRNNRLATPFGALKNTILSGNSSPTPGTDAHGATAAIKSYTKADLSKFVTGAALDLKIAPQSLQGKNGIVALSSLIQGFVKLGGYFMQIDTVTADTLRAAQRDPAAFKTLSVRVSGWNARFVTLSKEWQDMIIQRTEHNG
jgi:formate C-acetyltransferase